MTVASIDIGSNTTLLLIATIDLTNKSFTTVVDRLCMPRISKGLTNGTKISDENLLRLYTVLDEYSQLIKSHNCETVFVAATNAFRIAENSSEIVQEIKRVFNLHVEIIDGQTEALYSYLGAISNYNNNKEFLVIDIGGGSTEIISGIGSKISFRKSLPLGVVSMSEKYFTAQPPEAIQIESMKEAVNSILSTELPLKTNNEICIAVAGTPTTLSSIKLGLKEFNANMIEGSSLKTEDLDKQIIQISHLTKDELSNNYGSVIEGREDILLAGTIILKQFMGRQEIKEIRVSTRGLRHGILINKLFNPMG